MPVRTIPNAQEWRVANRAQCKVVCSAVGAWMLDRRHILVMTSVRTLSGAISPMSTLWLVIIVAVLLLAVGAGDAVHWGRR
jgi:hypothetical protein